MLEEGLEDARADVSTYLAELVDHLPERGDARSEKEKKTNNKNGNETKTNYSTSVFTPALYSMESGRLSMKVSNSRGSTRMPFFFMKFRTLWSMPYFSQASATSVTKEKTYGWYTTEQ